MLNFQRRQSEGSIQAIINTIICKEIVEICAVYESMLKIWKMENRLIFKKISWVKIQQKLSLL